MIVLIALNPDAVLDALESYSAWMIENKELGCFLMAFICIPAIALGVPGTLLNISTGYIMHEVFDQTHWKSIPVGFTSVFLGTWVGSIVAFFIGRYILKGLT